MPDQLAFNDSLNLLGVAGTGLTPLQGNLTVDYGTNTVTGSVQLDLGSVGVQTYSSFTLTATGTDPQTGLTEYTLSSNDSNAIPLTNFSIQFEGQLPTSIDAQVNLLSTNVAIASATDASVTSTVVCFVAGTLIRTPKGEVPIERLSIGDLVITASGAEKPIKWLGSRTIDCHQHSNSEIVHPIRISAGAFGHERPTQDLFVSPGHAVCVTVVEEILIPANALINGATVEQVKVDEVSYWHLELEEHDIIFANGLPTESYIDIGNRKFFEGSGINVDPRRDAAYSITDYCRPFIINGVLLDAARNRLRSCAEKLGWRIDKNPEMDLRVWADGEVIFPDWHGNSARFIVPADAADVRLISSSSTPLYVADSCDPRSLGVFIESLSIDDGLTGKREIDLGSDLLRIGFYDAEASSSGELKRWTTGSAQLPPSLWESCKGTFFLRLDIGSLVPRWVAPAAQIEFAGENVASFEKAQRRVAA